MELRKIFIYVFSYYKSFKVLVLGFRVWKISDAVTILEYGFCDIFRGITIDLGKNMNLDFLK